MVDIVVLEGKSEGESHIERLVRNVRYSAIYDNLEKFYECPCVGRKILATNDIELVDLVSDFDCEVHFFDRGGEFHFGDLFTDIVNKYDLREVFYLGGGAGLFLTRNEIDRICGGLAGNIEIFFTNNFFSSDFVAFSPGSVVNTLAMPRFDNLLAYLLKEEAGFRYVPIEPSRGTMFDIDTPSDVRVLGVCSGVGRKTEETLKGLKLGIDPLKKIFNIFTNKDAELLVFGRINSTVCSHLESHLKCRLRIVSEERGMKARGRIERGEVVSLIGSFIKEVGIGRFIQSLSECCSGAFIDSRVIFAHLRKKVSREDRFLSDFGDYDNIQDEFVREFTRLCGEAPIPVILGGHSLVAGGLWVLAEQIQ